MAVPKLKLNTGAEIPAIGFGTWQLSPEEAYSSVTEAIKTGYRLVDTARIYRNEAAVGQAIGDSKLAREELFVTTKLWPQDFGYESGLKAFEQSLELLGLDYLDLYLLHWPSGEERKDAWRALSQIHKQGRSKSVGVSNYMVEDLEELLAESDLVPAVNQIEFHPFIYRRQMPVLEMCRKHRILVEAYSPLTVGRSLNHPAISKIAQQYGKSNAQIILRWCLQHDTVPIPRSANPEHIKENLKVFDFELSDEHMVEVDQLGDDSAWPPNQM
jgi:diketogulonate reductase-like aldo/keto reductase